MNNHGAAGTGGYNPQVVVAYLDSRMARVPQDSGQKTVVLNGYRLSPDDQRTIRRWRNQAKSVSQKGLNRMFKTYGLDVKTFKTWAKRRKLNPRGHLTRPR